MLVYKCPIWNGEFGPVYADPAEDEDAEGINQDQCNMFGQQLNIYDKHKISWSIWLYKDIGVQGMLHTDRSSKWNRTVQPPLDKKKQYRLDAWGVHNTAEAEAVLNPLVEWIGKICPTAKDAYPGPWQIERHFMRAVIQTW